MHRTLSRFVSALPVAALLSLPPAASATITTVWVGAGAQCDNASLTSAITLASTNAGDTTYIYLADDENYGGLGLDLDSRNINLTGGYAHCHDANPVEHTAIVAAHGARAMRIGSSGGNRHVTLSNLDIRGGVISGDGGGLSITGPVTVTLSNDWVRSNQADYGGGVYLGGSVSEQPALLLVDGTRIGYNATYYNTATNGAGIYCLDALISLDGASIVYNQAGSGGGGLFLNNCGVYTGGTFSDDNQISQNQATEGGGIYAANGSTVQFGLNGGHNDIALNSATDSGGGMVVYGTGTQVTLYATRLSSNSAGSDGGGVFVNNGARFELDRGDRDEVCSVSHCASLISNTAGDGFAVYAAGGSIISIARSEIAGPANVVTTTGAALAGNGGNTHFGLYGVLMDRLPGAAGLSLANGAMADIANLTVSGNAFAYDFQLVTNDTLLSVSDSIVWDAPATAVFGAGGAVFSTRNTSHDPATLSGSNVDPAFVNPANFDFHLRGDSPDLDTYASNPNTPVTDLDGNPRPFDLFVDNGGAYDRGAYELGDEIFADGLESN